MSPLEIGFRLGLKNLRSRLSNKGGRGLYLDHERPLLWVGGFNAAIVALQRFYSAVTMNGWMQGKRIKWPMDISQEPLRGICHGALHKDVFWECCASLMFPIARGSWLFFE